MADERWRVRLQGIGGPSDFSFVLSRSSSVSLGRSKKKAQLVVDTEAFPATSRVHCSFERGEDGSVRVVDLNSLNGTFVNRRRVERAVLSMGDTIIAGTSEASNVAVGGTLPDRLVTPGKSAEFQVTWLSVNSTGLGPAQLNSGAQVAQSPPCRQLPAPHCHSVGQKRERALPPVAAGSDAARQDQGGVPECVDLESPPKRHRSPAAAGNDAARQDEGGVPECVDLESPPQRHVRLDEEQKAPRRGGRTRTPVDYTGQEVDKRISAAIRAHGTLSAVQSRPSPLCPDLRNLGLPTTKPRGIKGWHPSNSTRDLGAVLFCKETDADFCKETDADFLQGSWFRSVVVRYDQHRGYTLRYDDTRTSLDGSEWIPVEGDLNNETLVCLLRGSGVAPRPRRRRRACGAVHPASHDAGGSGSGSGSDSDSDSGAARPALRSQPSLSQQDDDDQCYDDACIRVGRDFQADIPSLAACDSSTADTAEASAAMTIDGSCTERSGTVLWNPSRYYKASASTERSANASEVVSGATAVSLLQTYCEAAIPAIRRRIGESADIAVASEGDAASDGCVAGRKSSFSPSPLRRGGPAGRARGRSSTAVKPLSTVEATTIALRALHHANYQTETALELLDAPCNRNQMPVDFSGRVGSGSDSMRVSITELLHPHELELGWWSAADLTRLIATLRKSRFDRLGSPRQLMMMSARLGKSAYSTQSLDCCPTLYWHHDCTVLFELLIRILRRLNVYVARSRYWRNRWHLPLGKTTQGLRAPSQERLILGHLVNRSAYFKRHRIAIVSHNTHEMLYPCASSFGVYRAPVSGEDYTTCCGEFKSDNILYTCQQFYPFEYIETGYLPVASVSSAAASAAARARSSSYSSYSVEKTSSRLTSPPPASSSKQSILS